MCGIGGYAGKGDEAILQRMCTAMAHRGPDAFGVWTGEGAGLAHRRLSIIDLSETGAQPMSAAGAHLAFNGEVYNAPALRSELEKAGHRFRGHSDTEVILRGYLQWGSAVIPRLSGMFAIAIWDEEKQSMLLARDRVGIKPLFYAGHAGGLVFGSEIKAVFSHTAMRKRLNRPMIDAYLALGYVPRPQTIFAGVSMLPPAHMLVWENGKQCIERFWQLPENGTLTGSEDELAEELDRRLQTVVAEHLLSDVEVGAFLSGGVDSSLVSAVAATQLDVPLRTFTIGFEGGGDERGWGRMVAEHIGSTHQEHLASLELAEKLPQLLRYLEQPLFDNSILPTYLVSELAAKQVKVVLAGDGGDEPFFGYDWTRHALGLPRLSPPLPFPGWGWAYRAGKAGLLQRAAYDVSHGPDARYLRRITASRAFRYPLYTQEFRASLDADPLRLIEQELDSHSGSSRFAYADMAYYLPEDVLFKVDRMSMAHGLEVRVPLLDHGLLEWEMSLPVEMRFRHGRGKYLLRKVAARYLPPDILKPRKQGFTIPIGTWLRQHLGGEVEAVFTSGRFAERGIFDPRSVLKLMGMHRSGRYDLGHRIWSIYVLEMWFREWLDH